MTTMQQVADSAHAAADLWVALVGRTPEYPIDCARTAASCAGHDPDGPEGQFYVERWAGHMANLEAGTKGY